MAKTASPPPALGWPVAGLTIDPRSGVALNLGPVPAGSDPGAFLRAEGLKEVEALKTTAEAVALVRQRQLLAGTRDQLSAAQGAVARARADSAAALAQGDGAAALKAEAELKAAVQDVDVIATRLGLLLEAIKRREGEVTALWSAARSRLFARLREEARARLERSRAALAAALPTDLVGEAVAATALHVLLSGSPEHLGLMPAEHPLGRTPEPPPPPREPDPILTRANYGPLPTIAEPVRCSHCQEDCYVTTDGVKRESVLTCPRCGPRNVPRGHPLEAHVKRVVEAEPPLEAAEAPA